LNYYPYGEERPVTAATETREKFGTYQRDLTGLDYADQRYYGPGTGRFLTADPYRASGGPRDPGSWNRYAYTRGDPINFNDPYGLMDFGPWAGVEFPSYWEDASLWSGGVSKFDWMDQWAGGGADVPPQTPDPSCVQDAISTTAQNLGLNLEGFSDISVHVAGTSSPEGGNYGETNLNLSGSSAAVQDLVNQLCTLGFSNNGQCPGGAGSTPLVGQPHQGFTGNFRAPGLTNSLQVNTNSETGQVQIDVDPYNPAAAPILGALLHGLLQVIPNKVSGGDNTYGCSH
jgi:RHS repeat-associated protein